jgi:uroporphyrin-III C-methyltransferase/precorrin-2 dehydrogenase/sirohydrochlorin ferrochelatase
MTTLLGVDLRGRRVLLAGGGPVAARRATALLADGADLRVVAPELCEDLAELATADALEWCRRPVIEADLDDVWLVHAATGDRGVDGAVARWAADRHLWCVVASAADRGTARTPATAVVGEIRLGVVSEGAPDPGRASAVSAALADALREGRVDLRRRRTGLGRVLLVGGGPGDPDLLTLRARRALAEADVVVTDRLGPTAVLDELAPDVEVVHVGKAPGHHPVPQEEINRILVERASRGQVVVRLKGGDPFVYGRGGEEVLACRVAGIDVTVVPGVSSAFAAPAAAGIPLTHRGTTAAVHVVNGHDGLGAPALLALRARSATIVVLMGVEMLPRLVDQALRAGVAPDLPVAIIEEASTPRQRVTRAPLGGVVEVAAGADVRPPAVVVLGDVAEPGLLVPSTRTDGAVLR